MSEHEDLIMRRSAEIICQKGGDILNVGFGMGIIDGYIRQLNPTSHTIIEAHPGVVQRAFELDFDKTATIHQTDWRQLVEDWIQRDIKFDGIYFDTIILDWHVNEWLDFSKIAHQLVKPGGIYAYFNHNAAALEPNLEQIICDTGFTPQHEMISLSDIKQNIEGEFNPKLLNETDYKLIWYIKNE